MAWVSNLHAEKGNGPDSGRVLASLGTHEDDPPDETRTTIILMIFVSRDLAGGQGIEAAERRGGRQIALNGFVF
jgi:hypothetical protein